MLKPLRHALRMLRKNPGFTLVAVLSLGIGIGATSASFSIADVLLLRPLPVLEPSRVVSVTPAKMGAFGADVTISYPDYRDFRDNNRSFDGLIAEGFNRFTFSPDAIEFPKIAYGVFVSGNFFRTLGVQPALGRGFLDSEDRAVGRDAVVVLGHDFWVSQFNSNPSIVGSTIRLDGMECTVIGVASEQFTGIDNQNFKPSFFVPLAMSPRLNQQNTLESRDVRWLTVKGRLKPGISIAQAQADLGAIASRLEQLYPATNRDQKFQVQTEFQLRVKEVPPDLGIAAMQGLLALCVLLVACANVAGLLLSRARARSREMAVRIAIGAGRGALIRQLLLENLLLGLAGGLAGLGLDYANVSLYNSLPVATDVPVDAHAAVDHRVLLFTIAAALLSTFLFGLAPALQTTRLDLVPALKAADADSGGRRRFWGRNFIVAGQVALSLVLLVISVVVWQGFRNQYQQGAGFRTDHLYLTTFDTTPSHYSEEQTRRFFKELLDKTRLAPGVRSAALTSVVPLGNGLGSTGVLPEGSALRSGEQIRAVPNAYVSEGYFATLGIPIVRGRGFLESDGANTPLVAVVNTLFAEHYWPHQDALGRRFHSGDANGPLVQVVGIARTGKYIWIAESPQEFVYFPYTQGRTSALTVVAESTGPDAGALAPVLREVVRNIDSAMPYANARTMQNFFSQRATKITNTIVEVVASLGLMGLMLALVGLYALVAYSVSRRSREIGIRMAIGADRQSVLRMVLRQGLVLGSIGAGAGLILSVFACRAVTSALWIGRLNWALLPAVAAPLLLVTMLAAYVPARRASLIDPMRALRDE
jgi:macrolide transport system ATP-binding/permease protein